MASQGYYDWLAAGSPYVRARPTLQLRDLLRTYGYTVYDYPDPDHLTADRPQDHTPFSVTGWPISSKRWVGHAIDVMPPNATAVGKGAIGLPDLARNIIRARNANAPGTGWIKYLNWTDEAGVCRQERWMPDHSTVSSTDKGHIHISARSDCDTSDEVITSGWDPVKGNDMALTTQESSWLQNVYVALFSGGISCGEKVTVGGKTGNSLFLKLDYLADLLRQAKDAVNALNAKVGAIAAVDPVQVAAALAADATFISAVTAAIPAATLDPAALKAVLVDPQVLAALAKAVNDDAARRQAE